MTSSRPGWNLRAPYALLRRYRDLRLLLAADLVSLSGDWILGVGLAYAVYDLTGSTLASAATLLAAFLPQVLAGPIAGVLADRWDRRRTMIGANLLMAAGLTPLLWVSTADRVWIVYVALGIQSVVEVFFAPAEQAFLPRVVEDDDLVAREERVQLLDALDVDERRAVYAHELLRVELRLKLAQRLSHQKRV